MILFKGGISKVEIDDNVGFTTPTEVPGIMKESKVDFNTPTEDDASNKPTSGGKEVMFNLVTEDMTQNTFLTELQTYENDRTEFFIRITGINTTQKLVLKQVKGYTHLAPAEAPKTFKRVIAGKGYADTEANLMALTLS